VLVLLDFLGQQAHQLTPQSRHMPAQFIELSKGDFAQAAVFQANRRAVMDITGNGIEPHQFAGEMKTRNLLGAIRTQGDAFYRTGPNGKDRFQRIALAKKMSAAMHGRHALDQMFQPAQILLPDAVGQTQLAQTTGPARPFEILHLEDGVHALP